MVIRVIKDLKLFLRIYALRIVGKFVGDRIAGEPCLDVDFGMMTI